LIRDFAEYPKLSSTPVKWWRTHVLKNSLTSAQDKKEQAVRVAIKKLTDAHIARASAESIIYEFAAALGWGISGIVRNSRQPQTPREANASSGISDELEDEAVSALKGELAEMNRKTVDEELAEIKRIIAEEELAEIKRKIAEEECRLKEVTTETADIIALLRAIMDKHSGFLAELEAARWAAQPVAESVPASKIAKGI
jgi:hypothetical protein